MLMGIKESTVFVRKAICACKLSLPDYYRKTLEQRIPGANSSGSTFMLTNLEQLEIILQYSIWKEVRPKELADGCKAFIANIPGHIGVQKIDNLKTGEILVLKDRKCTGFLTPEVERPQGPLEYFTILITGPIDQGSDTEIMYTLHPGLPIWPSSLAVSHEWTDGMLITKEKALEMGLTWVKIVPPVEKQ